MTRPKIGKNPFQNPVLPDGRVVRPGDRLRRQTRQDPMERAARTTQASRRAAERQRLAMEARTDKTDPHYKAKIERQEVIEQAATASRRAQRELAEAMVEQAEMLRLGREAAAILAVNRSLTDEVRDYLDALNPEEWPAGATYGDRVRRAVARLRAGRGPEQDDAARTQRLVDVFKAAGVPDRQARAWLLNRLGMSQPEIGAVMGGVKRSNVNELVTKAHHKLTAYTVGRVTGIAMADRIIAEDTAARAARGPYGAVTRARAHGSGTGRARSVKFVPQGDDAGLQDAVRRATKTRKGGGRRSFRDDG